MYYVCQTLDRLSRVNTSEPTPDAMHHDPPWLRPLRATDVTDVLAAFRSNPDMSRQGRVTTREEATRYVDSLLADDDQLPWAIELDQDLVGLVCVTVDRTNRNGWFWYWLTDAVRGRGFMKRAAATIANWALTDAGLHRLELGHRVNNPASGAVARAAGFLREGTEREKFLIGDERMDVDTYSRLASDPRSCLTPLTVRTA